MMVGYLIVILLFAFPLICYKKVYFKPLTVLMLPYSASSVVCSVRPGGRWFRGVSSGKPSSWVHLVGDLYAYVVDDPDHPVNRIFKGVEFHSDIYVFRKGRFGRLKSVDLASRQISDLLNNMI